MGAIKTWFNTATPMSKMFMAVGITTGLFIVHRRFYEPYAKRKRYERAELWANMIIEQEENESKQNTQ